MNRINITLLVLTGIIVAAGVAAGSYSAQPATGIGGGILLIALLVALLRPSSRQWLIPAAAAGFLVLFTVFNYPWGIVWGLVSIGLALWFGSLSVRPLYGGSLTDAAEATLRLASGQPISTQVVVEPKKLVEVALTERMGPLRLVVKPYAAVVLVNGSSQTRIVGPQMLDTQPREYVSCVYSLSRKHHLYSFEKVLTSDLMTTEVKLGISYGLAVSLQAQVGVQPLSANELEAIRRFQPLATNWMEEFNQLVEARVRESIGQRTLDNVLETTNWQPLRTELRALLRATLEPRGIRIGRIDLISIQPDHLVSRARRERWIATTNAETILRYERARAEAWGEALQLLGGAYEEAVDNGLPPNVILRELLRRILDQAATDVSTKGLIPPQLSRLLAQLEDSDQPPSGSP